MIAGILCGFLPLAIWLYLMLFHHGFWRQVAGVSSGHTVHGNQTVHSAVDGFQRPFSLGDVVVYEAANLADFVDDPAWLSE